MLINQIFLPLIEEQGAARIYALRGGKVEFAESNLSRALSSHNPKRLSRDRVALNVQPSSVAEHQSNRSG